MAHLVFLTGTPTHVAAGSGTSVGIAVLREAVIALGHEVTLIAPEEGRGQTTRGRIVFNLAARRRLRGLGADVLVGFDLDGVFVSRADAPLHVAAIKGVLADEATHERGMSRLTLALQARLEAQHVRRADRVIATSAYSAAQIARFYGIERETIAVVPELIDLAAWTHALDEAPRHEGRPRILTVAHLYPRKGIDTLLRAFARVPAEAELRIVGTGPERSRLEALASDLALAPRVHFLGHLPFRDLVAEYRHAALFALPSTQEGFGIVFLEAMASGLPIVAARAAAVPEVLEAGVSAILVDPDDEAALTDALTRLLADRALRESLGAAGRERVQQFDAPVVAQRFLAAIGVG
jgi:glycosyltransferase involved in cell wall biosynthesis